MNRSLLYLEREKIYGVSPYLRRTPINPYPILTIQRPLNCKFLKVTKKRAPPALPSSESASCKACYKLRTAFTEMLKKSIEIFFTRIIAMIFHQTSLLTISRSLKQRCHLKARSILYSALLAKAYPPIFS